MGLLEFIKGNFFHVLPLLAAAGFAVSIMIERTKTLAVKYPMKNSQGFFDRIRDLVFAGRTGEAVSLCDQYPEKPVAKIVKGALLRAHLPESSIEHGIEIAVNDASLGIKKRTAYLATIANVATLLGLFGTIFGLIQSFEAVGHADAQQKSALLASGIATAMNATMMGLGVAIPCMIAFSFLMNKTNKLISDLENAGILTLDLLKQRFYAVEAPESIQQNGSSQNGSGVRHAA